MSGFSLPALLGIFAAAAAVIWVAGVQLSNTTDAIDMRFGLGQALGGLILLAVATNLPEIAIVGTAAVRQNFDIATGNILGGIAIQTVVLVVLDGVGVPRRPLTFATASLIQVLEGALVIAVLAVAVIATILPSNLVVARIDPSALLILLFWVGGLFLIRRASKELPWRKFTKGEAPDESRNKRAGGSRHKKRPLGVVLAIFGVSAIATLVAGVFAEESGSAIAETIHLNGALFGGTVLAAATAMPEVSTGLAAVRMEDFELAVSDIFGGNAFLPVLFFPATLLAGTSVLGRAQKTDVYLAVTGMLLTSVYLCGLVMRPRRQFLRLGADSALVLVLYVIAIVGLYFIDRGG
jgi:cation:H+ antiporter